MTVRTISVARAIRFAALGLALAAPAQAADFTFKRIKTPAAGARKLINIQIEPVAPVERVLSTTPDLPEAEPAPKLAGTAPGSKTLDWFWAALSPDLSAADTRRLDKAIGVLEGRKDEMGRLSPSRDRLTAMIDTHGTDILKATAGTRVSPALVLSVMAIESGGNPGAVSPAGAVGLMQLMPATAKRFGVTDRTNPAQSLKGGVAYLDFLLDTFGGDALLALAGYNAGEGAVMGNGGVPPYAETRAYVPKVVAAWREARLMCFQPPVRATDGCLFTGLKVASQ